MQLRLGLTFHHVFYAPYYVALHRGLFASEGLELTVTVPGDGRQVVAGLLSGTMDVGLGGIMRSLQAWDQGERNAPIHFARVNDRDGFFLIGRTEPFDWPDLYGRRLILFSEAPTPWYVLRSVLLERGYEPDRIEVVAGLPAPEAAAAFRAREADLIEEPDKNAEVLEA
jgi:NitT/TauT family transport system substrate-binding protein